MLKTLQNLLAAIAAFFVLINREKDRRSGADSAQLEHLTEIEIRAKNANQIRSDNISDDFLLPPNQRDS